MSPSLCERSLLTSLCERPVSPSLCERYSIFSLGGIFSFLGSPAKYSMAKFCGESGGTGRFNFDGVESPCDPVAEREGVGRGAITPKRIYAICIVFMGSQQHHQYKSTDYWLTSIINRCPDGRKDNQPQSTTINLNSLIICNLSPILRDLVGTSSGHGRTFFEQFPRTTLTC